MYDVQDRILVGLYLNDYEFPIDAINPVNYVTIGSSLRGKLPQMSMSFLDVTGAVHKLPLIVDGTKIRMFFQLPGVEKPVTYNFRLFNVKAIPTNQGIQVTLDGYLDFPKYWLESSANSWEGTSQEVLAQIASYCGLRFDGPNATSDPQIWYQQGMRYGDFARMIANHGYSTDQSRMTLGVDIDGVMRYIDANLQTDPVYTVSSKMLEPGTILAVELLPSTSSGFANLTNGYGVRTYNQSLTKAPEVYQELSLNPGVRDPNINFNLKNSLDVVTTRFTPIDVGNTGLMTRGAYQNSRYGMLFSQSIDILLTYTSSPIRLLQRINVVAYNSDGTQDMVNSGLYIVSGRGINIQGANYGERIRAVRHGTNLERKNVS